MILCSYVLPAPVTFKTPVTVLLVAVTVPEFLKYPYTFKVAVALLMFIEPPAATVQLAVDAIVRVPLGEIIKLPVEAVPVPIVSVDVPLIVTAALLVLSPIVSIVPEPEKVVDVPT